MTDTASRTDMGLGLGLAMAAVAVVAAVAMGGAGFVGALETAASEGAHTADLQIVSGAALTVSLLAGSVAIVAMHAYGD